MTYKVVSLFGYHLTYFVVVPSFNIVGADERFREAVASKVDAVKVMFSVRKTSESAYEVNT